MGRRAGGRKVSFLDFSLPDFLFSKFFFSVLLPLGWMDGWFVKICMLTTHRDDIAIESRVARIKARVAELTGGMPAAGAGGGGGAEPARA